MGNIQATKVKTAVPRNMPDTVPRIDGGGRTADVAKSAKKEEEKEAGKNRVDQTVKMWEKSTLRACSHVCPSIARRSVSDRPSPPPSWTNFFPRGRIVFLLSSSYAHVTQ